MTEDICGFKYILSCRKVDVLFSISILRFLLYDLPLSIQTLLIRVTSPGLSAEANHPTHDRQLGQGRESSTHCLTSATQA